MSQPAHTYAAGCDYAPVVSFSGSKGHDEMPSLRAQFFYSSPLPIDDPLSAVPTPTGSEAKSIKYTPRPFSAHDNKALEEAWVSLASDKDRKVHQKSQTSTPMKKSPEDGKSSGANTSDEGAKKDKATGSSKKSLKKDEGSPDNAWHGPFTLGGHHTHIPPKDLDQKVQDKKPDVKKPEDKKSDNKKSDGKQHTDNKPEYSKDNDLMKKVKDHIEADIKDIDRKAAEKTAEVKKAFQKAEQKVEENLKSDSKKHQDKKAHNKEAHDKRPIEDKGVHGNLPVDKKAEKEEAEKKSAEKKAEEKKKSEEKKAEEKRAKEKRAEEKKEAERRAAEKKTLEKHDKRHTNAESSKGSKPSSRSSSPAKIKPHSTSPKHLDSARSGHGDSKTEAATLPDHKPPARPVSSSSKLSSRDNSPSPKKTKLSHEDSAAQHRSDGKPRDLIREDLHHLELDADLPTCCEELEQDSRELESHIRYFEGQVEPHHESSGSRDRIPNHKRGRSTSRLSEAQGDGPGDVHQSNISAHRDHESPERSVKAKAHQEKHISGLSLDGESELDSGKLRKSKSQSHADKLDKDWKPSSSVHQTGKEKLKNNKADGRAKSKSLDHGENIEPSDQHTSTHESDAGTTRRPFLKLPSRRSRSEAQSQASHHEGKLSRKDHDRCVLEGVCNASDNERDLGETEEFRVDGCKAYKNVKDHSDVPVGISRLHVVEIPALKMKPIYWSPVHDIAAVTRGTWFYKDTMLPVEPAVANQLEMGYREVRAWSETWSDQLNSALEVGAAGEEKIVHQLWPREDDSKTKLQNTDDLLSNDPHCAARCFHGEAAAMGILDPEDSDDKTSPSKTVVKKYANSQVIYKDAQNAFILKPTLQPSQYYGRKPLQKIKRGFTIGLHVVRGFDRRAWEKLHPSKKGPALARAEAHAPTASHPDVRKKNQCPGCIAEEDRPKIRELILVIHGIGQKLSERVESFHFTHAINTFRREVNVELQNPGVQKVLRKHLAGIMVLPVNWRTNLSFEDGGPKKDGDKVFKEPEFTLKDITPDTIPAVRNLISDVMLDIPYYMSHHKPTMVQAVIAEANRVYRLWCKNNPDFHKEGRVHLIAHSLGSAMALEVLSRQPSHVPRVELSKKINTKYFDFNTTNLFFVGSPAGFFLLLENGRLIPRYCKNKPGAEPGDIHDPSIVGNIETFGCLAVENIYNIMNYNDPIAYRLNATVDPQYAASLKNASVPSATATFFESIGNAMRSITPGVSAPNDVAVGQVVKPATLTRLPSQLEMEIHDFTREEIAEKKFYLLNDNGQVDWFLSSVGGPFDVQYINMLSAHSSYWTSPDFIRMIVTEVGRMPGKEHTLPNMRAAKIGHKGNKA